MGAIRQVQCLFVLGKAILHAEVFGESLFEMHERQKVPPFQAGAEESFSGKTLYWNSVGQILRHRSTERDELYSGWQCIKPGDAARHAPAGSPTAHRSHRR